MLAWFAWNTLAAAVLAAVVLVLCRLFRFRPAVQHALWLLVLAKLMTPAWIAWPWTPREAWQYVRPAVAEPAASPAVVGTSQRSPTGLVRDAAAAPTAGPSTAMEVAPPRARAPATPTPTVDRSVIPPRLPAAIEAESPWIEALRAGWAPGLLGLWAAGALAMLWIQVVQAVRFARRVRGGQEPPQWLDDELHRLAERLGVRPPGLFLVAELGHPVVWCLGRPKLLWPAELVDVAPGQVRGVILHELAHLRRRDHWVAWAESIGACVWWWNPLFWYVRRRVRECAEMACDAWVVWAMPDGRRTYAEALIEVVRRLSQGSRAVPALGALGLNRRNFERRLTMIFDENVSRRVSWTAALLIGLLGAAALPGWSQEAAESKQPPKEPPPASGMAAPAQAGADDPFGGAATEEAREASKPGPSSAASSPKQKPAPVPGSPFPGGTMYGGGYPGGMGMEDAAASPPAKRPEPKTIEVFRLKHREPTEVIQIVTGLLELTTRTGDGTAGEVFVLAVLRPAKGDGVYDMGGFAGDPYAPVGHPGMGMMMPGMMSGVAALDVRLTADPRTRAVIARGPKPLVEQVGEFVAALDKSDDEFPGAITKRENVRLIKYRHRRPDEMIRVLQELGIAVRWVGCPVGLGAAGGGMDMYGYAMQSTVAMPPVEPGGVFIAAGRAADLDPIQRLIESLDAVEGDKPAGGANFGVPGGGTMQSPPDSAGAGFPGMGGYPPRGPKGATEPETP